MRLIRHPRRPDKAPAHAHHHRPARRARELARLPLLERRARRRRLRSSVGFAARTPIVARPELTGLSPHRAVAGGRVRLALTGLDVAAVALPRDPHRRRHVRAAFASPTSVTFVVPARDRPRPPAAAPRRRPRPVGIPRVGAPIATGVHQVDSPVVDAAGTIYATCSGSRGQQSSVSIYRIGADGVRDVFVTGLTNATSMAFDPQGRLHVSSRFDGTVRASTPWATPRRLPPSSASPPGSPSIRGRALRRRSIRHHLPAVAQRPRHAVRVAAAQRRRLPPGLAPRRRGPLRHRSDHLHARPRLPDRPARRHPDGATKGSGGRRGLPWTPTARSWWPRRSPAPAASIASADGQADPELVVSGPALVGVAVHPAGGYVVATAEAIYRCG